MSSPVKKSRMELADDLPLDLSVKREKMISEYEILEKRLKPDPQKDPIIQSIDDTIFIVPAVPPLPLNISEKFLSLEWELSSKLGCIEFKSPVEYVYNPIEYAFDVHAKYVRKYCYGTKKILFLGMNPGPWGMAQTGVPFGEVSVVRDWLELYGFVGKPGREQPDRKITGFNCTRSEISGRRFWTLVKELCHTPDNFFRYSFLHNYCPIALMDSKGRNITPVELKGVEQKTLLHICDEALVATIKLLRVDIVVGIGRFAEKKTQNVVKAAGLHTQVVSIPHPSPRSLGNENWGEKAAQRLEELNLLKYFSK